MKQLSVTALPAAGPWPTLDPFLFCVHHRDEFPAGNGAMGVAAQQLRGRQLGSDFSGRDGWSMYHGERIPGFPAHPHRGFETISIIREGFVDHSDSLGATARIGPGDVQWMTAGRGIVHCEMFPLRRANQKNPTELFQLWLNLPAKSKMVAPYFTMMWAEQIPVYSWISEDESASSNPRACRATVYAGQAFALAGLAPPPDSFAASSDAAVLVATLALTKHARVKLPAAAPGQKRALYVFAGHASLGIDDEMVAQTTRPSMVELPAHEVEVVAGPQGAEALLLGGRPIGEPVAAYGPFVMNTRSEIEQAVRDYQRTQFGGWPWPSQEPVHPVEQERFALHPDGRRDQPPGSRK